MIQAITYTIEAEYECDVPVEGSFASDDPEADAELVKSIHWRLERGDVWAWAYVTVKAIVEVDGETFIGRDTLGGCSYDNETDFAIDESGHYYHDMKHEALADLKRVLGECSRRGVVAAKALRLLNEASSL